MGDAVNLLPDLLAKQNPDGVNLFGDSLPPGYGDGFNTTSSPKGKAPGKVTGGKISVVPKGPVLEAAPERGPLQKMVDYFHGDSMPVKDVARAQNLMALSKQTGLSVSEVERRYDELTAGMRDQPLVSDVAIGAGEAGVNLLTGAVGLGLGSLAAARSVLHGKNAETSFNQVADRVTIKPKTQMGKDFSEALAAPIIALDKAVDPVSDYVLEKTGSPDVSAAVASAMKTAPYIAGVIGLPGMARGVAGVFRSALKTVAESTPYRMATIKERGLVVQTLEETLKNNPELTEADLVRMSKDYFEQARVKRTTGETTVSDGVSPSVKEPNISAPIVRPAQTGVNLMDEVPVEDVVPKPLPPAGPDGVIDNTGVTEGPSKPADIPGALPVEASVSPVPAPEVMGTGEADASGITNGKPISKPEKGAGIRTVRGAIKAMGGINFGTFTGELRDMPVSVKYLSKKNGMPLDIAEQALKSEGYLTLDESLLDLFRDDPNILRRGPLRQDLGDKPVREYTDQEKKIIKDMNYEPEEPPDGTYRVVDAQDLPVGETLDIIDGHGPDGWDRYKVIAKDPFGVTLKDGRIVELKPTDPVHVNVDGIEHKIGSDGLFDGQDIQVDPVTGEVNHFTPGDSGVFFEMKTPAGGGGSSPVKGRATRSGDVKTPNGRGFVYADLGGYEPLPSVMQLPEIVEIVRSINEGKVPHVKRHLGNALGLFHYNNHQGGIKLLASIFADPALAQRVMAHELGHMVDWLPDKDLKRGNILGRIASLKKYLQHQIEEAPGVGGVHISPKEKARLRQEAERLLRAEAEGEIDGEITQDMKITPQDVLSIFNALEPSPGVTPALHNYIKGLSTAEKKSIVKAALKGVLPEDIQRFAAGASGGRSSRDVTFEDIEKKFRELFVAELKKRRLIHRDMVMDELKAVSQTLKPFDPSANASYTKYRHSSKELYADAISALITVPNLLKDKAPIFYKSLFNYMDRKPDVKAVWEEIQDRIKMGPDAVSDNRIGNIKGMFRSGHSARRSAGEAAKLGTMSLVDELMTGLVDRSHPALKVVRNLEKSKTPQGVKARELRYRLEELPYLSSEADVMMRKINDQVLAPIKAAGLVFDDLGTYQFLMRVMGDRSGIANPLGHTPETAAQDYSRFMDKLGDRASVIENAAWAYQDIRAEHVLKVVREAGLFPSELLDRLEDNDSYTRFSVVHYLNEKFGSGTSSRVYSQIGTLSDIENPMVPSVLQDLSMLRAARMNIVKRDLVDVFKSVPDLIQAADLKYSKDRRGLEPVRPNNRKLDIITVMRDGKPYHYYVSRKITDMFKRDPVEASAVASIIRAVSTPVRELLVAKNPLWMTKNVFRDFLTTMKNVPELKLHGAPVLMKYYAKAWREVWADVMKGERSKDIEDMMRDKMLVKHRHFTGWDDSMETELDRLAHDFGLSVAEARASKGARERLKQLWELVDKAGKVSDIVGKVAAYKYLNERTTRSRSEIGHMVRSRVGTPDIYRRGGWNTVTNNLFMFSNVGKEGLRAAYESFREDPSGYAWKTFVINILPHLVVAGIASGLIYKFLKSNDATKDNEKLLRSVKRIQRILDGVSEYDKSMYTVVPIGLTKSGKSAFLRIPVDYDGQFFGALAHKLIAGKFMGADGILNLAADQVPYRLNPILSTTGNLITYYINGQNPVDRFRGRNVIPDRDFAAGHPYTDKALARAAWESIGGGTFYKPAYDDLEKDETAWKKSMRVFGVNAFAQFYKESDQGIRERIDGAKKEIEKNKAVMGIKRTESLIRVVNGKVLTEEDLVNIASGGNKAAALSELRRLLVRKVGDVYLSELVNAKSREEKVAVIRLMMEDNFMQGGAE